MKKWICNVCGYIHEGDTPPDTCPVCGVGPEEFSLYEEKAEPVKQMKKWICNVCGYIHEGDAPPDTCPVCGVGPEEFSLYEEKSKPVKRWKCTICDYIHEGDEPPDKCPLCGYSGEYFVLLGDEVVGLNDEAIRNTDSATMNATLNEISYGLYVVAAAHDGKMNGQTANSMIQLTTQPAQIGICLNKNTLTHEYVMASGRFTISLLAENQVDYAKMFGHRSGRNVDKFADIEYYLGLNGCPIIKDCVGYLEAEVLPQKTVDVGTHTLFVAKVTAGRRVTYAQPLTYSFFRSNKSSFAQNWMTL